MTVQVISDTTESYANLGSTYRYVQMECGKHRAMVAVVTGKHPHLTVMVDNASHRAWRRLGRDFASAEAAKANYKTAEIRAMIDYATAN